jgi:hypothetical protein
MTIARLLTAALAAGLAIGCSSLARASAFDAAVERTPGLLAYFPFTFASQANSTVHGYTGVLVNRAAVGGPGSGPPVGDQNSSALVLPNEQGATAYATAGGVRPLMGRIGNSGSIVAWINLASLPSSQGRIFSIAGESAFGNDFDLQIDNSDDTLRFYTDNGGYTAAPAFTVENVGQWLFIAATFSAGRVRTLYINGVAVGGSTPGPHRLSPEAPFYVGQSNVFPGRHFDGAISDVAVFNTDLTAAQVADLYLASRR